MRKGSRWVLFVLWSVTSLASADDREFLSWLRTSLSDMNPLQGREYTTVLHECPSTNPVVLSVSPDAARCVIFEQSLAQQLIVVRDMSTDHAIPLYSNREGAVTGFSPLDVLWAPDGDRLLIKYGDLATRHGRWFAFNPSTASIISNAVEYEALARLHATERAGLLAYDAPQPVWTLGGKEYESDTAARKAGFVALLAARSSGRPDNVVQVFFSDTEWCTLVLGYRDSRQARLYVLYRDELVDSIDVAGPLLQHILFQYVDDHLVARCLPFLSFDRRFAKSVDFGQQRLERVTDLGTSGILLQTVDQDRRCWRLFNAKKIPHGQ